MTQIRPDGWQLLEQRDGNNAVVTRYFAQGEQRLTSSDAGDYFYTYDHPGSVRKFLDGSGAVRARYDYDVWGNRTKLSGDLESEIGFTGYWSHAPSGLYLSPTRAYSSALGRFISRDPIGEEGGLNLYEYVGNDPVNAVDPLGLDAQIMIYRIARNSTTQVFVYENGKYQGSYLGNTGINPDGTAKTNPDGILKSDYDPGTQGPADGTYQLLPKDNYEKGDRFPLGVPSITWRANIEKPTGTTLKERIGAQTLFLKEYTTRDRGAHESQASEFSKVFVKSA